MTVAMLAAVLVAMLTPAFAHADEPQGEPGGLSAAGLGAAAVGYSYSAEPLLAPFVGYVYVETDNPDPYSFRLVDKTSVYFSDNSAPQAGRGVYHLVERTFLDVAYEDAGAYRVKGGYIFCNYAADSDGGELVVQEAVSDNPARITYGDGWTSYPADMDAGWANTASKANCSALQRPVDYLIATYTDSSMGFFDKLDAVESGLMNLAHYPRRVLDDSKPKASRPYPFFATSPYEELSFNKHLDIYETSASGLLLVSAYPFILDSASYPNMMGAVAKRLDASCTVSYVSGAHWLRNVTLDGTTKAYGYGTPSGSDPIYARHAVKDFRFDGSAGDYGTSGTLSKLAGRYVEYGRQAASDAAVLSASLSGEAVSSAVAPGAWVRVAAEGWFGYGTTFGYVALGPSGADYSIASDAWVDGRYVNKYEMVELNATFDEHPTSGIIVRNQSYTDARGAEHVSDIRYSYESATDTWKAANYYAGGGWYSSSAELPERFVLTREQVEAMGVDANTNRIPVEGVVFDGTASPGTPFANTLVTGVSLSDAELSVTVGYSQDLTASVSPADATDDSVMWSSSDADVATVYEGRVKGVKPGVATITATTVDGAFTATCAVTVTAPTDITPAEITGLEDVTYTGYAHYPEPVVTLGGKTLRAGTDYTVSYADNRNAGTATVTVTGIGLYAGTKTANFTITKPASVGNGGTSGGGSAFKGGSASQGGSKASSGKKANTLKVTPKTAKISKSKKAKTIKRAKVLAVSKAQGKLTYKKLSGNKKITVSAKNGNVKVKGGLKKKTYKVRVKVTAAGNGNYDSGSRTVTFKVKIE